MNNRKTELQILNVLFCVLVVLIHILSFPVSAFIPGTLKYTLAMLPWRLSSFVVQGFVLLSGLKLFLTHKEDMPYFAYLKKRFSSIFLPYLVCSLVYYVYCIVVFAYPLDLWFFVKNTLLGKMAGHLYFVPLLLQFDLLLPLWKRIVDKCSPIFVIPAAFFASSIFESNFVSLVSVFTKGEITIYNDRLFTTYLSFWLIGCYIGKYYDEFKDLAKKNFKLISVTYAFSFVSCAVFSIYAFNGFAYVTCMNAIHYMYVISTIIFLLSATQRTSFVKLEKSKLFNTIDRLSYDIYLWHMLIIYISSDIVEKLGLVSQVSAFVLRFVFVYLVTFMVVFAKRKITSLLVRKSK